MQTVVDVAALLHRTAPATARSWWPAVSFGSVLVLVLLGAHGALASQESKQLYSRGLVDFHAGRYQQALQLFERAVAADPKDVYAQYYRGVTRGRLGDFDGAVTDLRAVIERGVALTQAPLELGVALVESGKYEPAIPWLERAQQTPALEGRASLFLGIAQLRLGRMAAARPNFQRAAQADRELRTPARYYEGIVAYQEGQFDEAERHFAYVAASDVDSAMGKEALEFIDNIRHGGRPLGEVYGLLGMQYDSNVVLAPGDDQSKADLAISKQADGRGIISAGGVLNAYRSRTAQLSLGYEFYQSLHFELTDFNLQDHRLSTQAVGNAGPFQFGLLGQYDYYRLDTDSFLQEGTGLPWVGINEGDVARTEVFYRVRRRDFLQLRFSELRDAFNHAAGIRQFAYLGAPDRYAVAAYRYDHESPINALSDAFGYDGHQVEGGLGWRLPIAITAEAVYAYRHEDYAPDSNDRRDHEHQIAVSLHRRLTELLAVSLAYLGTFNNSNKPEFEYDRHIGSVALEVRFH